MGIGDTLSVEANNFEESGCQSNSFSFLDESTDQSLSFGVVFGSRITFSPIQEAHEGEYVIKVFETSGKNLLITSFILEVLSVKEA